MASGAIRLPPHASGLAVCRDQEGTALLIADEDDQIVGEDRRRGHSVEALERAQRKRPAILSVGRVGGQTEVRKEHDDAVVVGRGSRRRRIVGAIDLVRTRAL